jgi:hypothetical protein
MNGKLPIKDRLFLLSLPEVKKEAFEKYCQKSATPISLLFVRKVAQSLVVSPDVLGKMLDDSVIRFLFGHIIFANPNLPSGILPKRKLEKRGYLLNPNITAEEFAKYAKPPRLFELPFSSKKVPLRGRNTYMGELYRHDLFHYIYSLNFYYSPEKFDKNISMLFATRFVTSYHVNTLETIVKQSSVSFWASPHKYLLIRKYRKFVAEAKKNLLVDQ